MSLPRDSRLPSFQFDVVLRVLAGVAVDAAHPHQPEGHPHPSVRPGHHAGGTGGHGARRGAVAPDQEGRIVRAGTGRGQVNQRLNCFHVLTFWANGVILVMQLGRMATRCLCRLRVSAFNARQFSDIRLLLSLFTSIVFERMFMERYSLNNFGLLAMGWA